MTAAALRVRPVWLAAAITIGILFAASPAHALTCNYQGPAGGDWRASTASWSCAAFPGAGDAVVLDGSDHVSVATQDEAAGMLTSAVGTTISVPAGRTLNVASFNTTGGHLASAGTLHVAGAFSKTGAGSLDL